MSNSLQCYELYPTSFLSLWDFPGKNFGVGCQGIFPTQGLNSHLLHCRKILYSLATKEAPFYAIYSLIWAPLLPLLFSLCPHLQTTQLFLCISDSWNQAALGWNRFLGNLFMMQMSFLCLFSLMSIHRNPGGKQSFPCYFQVTKNRSSQVEISISSLYIFYMYINIELPWWLSGKEYTCQCRRYGFNPWVGRIPGEGNGNSLQYCCLGSPMDRGAW